MSSAIMTNDWPWPDSLDALVAAPKHHKLLMEDDRVRVIHTRVLPGETVPLHTHRWPSVLILLGWSDCVRRDENGVVTYDSRTSGKGPEAIRQCGTRHCLRIRWRMSGKTRSTRSMWK